MWQWQFSQLLFEAGVNREQRLLPAGGGRLALPGGGDRAQHEPGLKYQHQIPGGYKRVRIHDEVISLWPLLYYALRVGDLDSCIYFASLDHAAKPLYECCANPRHKDFALELASRHQDVTGLVRLFSDKAMARGSTRLRGACSTRTSRRTW